MSSFMSLYTQVESLGPAVAHSALILPLFLHHRFESREPWFSRYPHRARKITVISIPLPVITKKTTAFQVSFFFIVPMTEIVSHR